VNGEGKQGRAAIRRTGYTLIGAVKKEVAKRDGTTTEAAAESGTRQAQKKKLIGGTKGKEEDRALVLSWKEGGSGERKTGKRRIGRKADRGGGGQRGGERKEMKRRGGLLRKGRVSSRKNRRDYSGTPRDPKQRRQTSPRASYIEGERGFHWGLRSVGRCVFIGIEGGGIGEKRELTRVDEKGDESAVLAETGTESKAIRVFVQARILSSKTRKGGT